MVDNKRGTKTNIAICEEEANVASKKLAIFRKKSKFPDHGEMMRQVDRSLNRQEGQTNDKKAYFCGGFLATVRQMVP